MQNSAKQYNLTKKEHEENKQNIFVNMEYSSEIYYNKELKVRMQQTYILDKIHSLASQLPK